MSNSVNKQHKAKTPNMTKSKINISKLNLNSSNIKRTTYTNTNNISNSNSNINNTKKVKQRNGFVKKNIFAGFKKRTPHISLLTALLMLLFMKITVK